MRYRGNSHIKPSFINSYPIKCSIVWRGLRKDMVIFKENTKIALKMHVSNIFPYLQGL